MSAMNIQSKISANSRKNFINPVIWEDLPDIEVIRVGDIYYMSASSFHFSPGAPILQSFNLADWEYIGHSVPELVFGERFYLNGQHTGAYVKGIWASTLRYRQSNGLFYWYGAIQGTERTYAYTAKDPKGPWTALSPINKFYYDLGLLIDEDDTMYLAYGTKSIYVSQLSTDGTSEVMNKLVFTSDEYLEGARMYNIERTYYIWLTRPHGGQYVLKSLTGPFGPYECQCVLGNILSPVPGSGYPHQGALVDTPEGNWYYMAFMDGFPGGRIPILAPITFDPAGWPTVKVDNSASTPMWQREYAAVVNHRHIKPYKTCFRTHCFDKKELEHCWEWNHNPDNSRWRLEEGRLLLVTGTITDNLYLATNTLTHRTIGPKSMATFCVDTVGLIDGDRASVSMFRNQSAYIGIHKDAGVSRLVYVDDLRTSPISIPTGWSNGHPVALDWSVDSNGAMKAETSLTHKRVWLRIKADITPAFSHGLEKETRYSTFEYSYDGTLFTQLGPDFLLTNEAIGFVGYRFAIFNFATKTLGGQLVLEQCDVNSWNESV